MHASKYGRILFDGRGFALYTFTRDPRGRSTCAGACAKKWPPDIVSNRPAAGKGAKCSLLRTVRRSDGSLQATYAGRPLYYYVSDKKPGQILCQNVSLFGGLWLVVRADGGTFTDRVFACAVDLPPGSTIWQSSAHDRTLLGAT